MFGYLISFVALLVILALLFPLLSGRRAPKPQSGTLESERPVVRTKPSADEANPAASITATPQQQENARRHTPPA